MDQSSYLKITNTAVISLLFAVLLALGIGVFYLFEDQRSKNESQETLHALMMAKKGQLTDWFEDEIQDANLISREKGFVQVIEAYMDAKDDPTHLLDMLNQIKLEHLYADLILLDTQGNHHISTNPSLAFNDSIDKIYYTKARLTDSCLVSELYRSDIDKRVYLDVIAAVKNRADKNLGGVVFKISPDRSLDNILIDKLTGLYKASLSLLWERSEGQWLTYKPHQAWSDQATCWLPLTTSQLLSGVEASLLAGLTSQKGALFSVTDLPNVPWRLLVELDDSARKQAMRDLLTLIVTIVGVLIVLCFVAVYLIIHFRQGGNIKTLGDKGSELESIKCQFRLTMDVLQEAVVVTDFEGSIRFLNLMAESMLGWKQGDAAGKHLDEVLRLTRPGTGVPLFNVQNWLMGDKAMTRFEDAWLITKAGDKVSVSCSLAYLPSSLEKMDGLLLTVRDESAVHNQQRLTLENEHRFRHLFQDAPDAFLLVDGEGSIRLANVMAVTLFGYTPEDILKVRVSDLVPATQANHGQGYKAFFNLPGKKVMGQGQRIQGLRKDGSLFDAYVTLSPVKDKDEMLAMVVVRDVSDAVERETRLRLHTSILDTMKEGVILFTLDNYTVVFANQRMCSLFGYTEEEIKRIGIKDLLAADEPFAGYLGHDMTFIKPETLNVDHTLRCVNRSGERFWAAAHIYTFEYGALGPVLIAVLQDISKQRQAEHQAYLNESRFKQLIQAFLANMSHELKTPLNSVIGFAQLIQEKDISFQERQEYAHIITDSARRLLTMLESLIDLSKLESGVETVVKREFVVEDFLDNVSANFRHLVPSDTVSFRTVLPDKAQRITLTSDPVKLGKALGNLIDNAIKYTQAGTVEVGFEVVDACVVFYVKDTGRGIRPEDREHIFDRFFQVDNSTAREYEGAGIGLTLSQGYARLLDGDLWLETTYTEGTLIKLKVPGAFVPKKKA